MSNSTVGRIGRQSLQQYVQSHREQTPEVAAKVKQCADGVLTYVRDSMAGEPGTDPRQAFHLMDDLRNGLLAVYNVPQDELAKNRQAANDWTAATNAAGHGKLGDKDIQLARASDVSGDGLQQPSDTGPVTVDLPSRTPDHKFLHKEAPSISSRAIASTVHRGAETVRAEDNAWQYVNDTRYYTAADALENGRKGLTGLWQQFDQGMPIIQAALSNRAVRLEEVGQYHEASSSSFSGDSSSALDAQRKLFGRGQVDASEASHVEGSSQKVVNATIEPAMVDAFQQLQSLRNVVSNMQSYPAVPVTIVGSQRINEDVKVETITTPPKTLFGHATPTVAVADKQGYFSDDGYQHTASRDLGVLPWAPAYIDVSQG